jgi:hypothetical protein
VNRRGAILLRNYHRQYMSLSLGEREEGDQSQLERSQLSNLLDSLDFLVEAEARDRSKLVDLLLVGCFAARLMNGARSTSCKSAKDRTSMFQTLEIARLGEQVGVTSR